jgi:hypothetical protein
LTSPRPETAYSMLQLKTRFSTLKWPISGLKQIIKRSKVSSTFITSYLEAKRKQENFPNMSASFESDHEISNLMDEADQNF